MARSGAEKSHVPKDTARRVRLSFESRVLKHLSFAVIIFFFGSQSLQSVIANGDTRMISFHHLHTGEDLTIIYKRDGRYDEAALEKINHELRDWRRDVPIKMDPHLIDLLWDVNREVNGKEPIQIVCGYRSPGTNAMLRARSRGVALFSQHMLGKAVDFFIPGAELSKIREIGLRMQRGGVGFYPTSGSPFVHLDTGNVRHWPKVSRDLLSKIFPDGKTIHIPADGRPMPGYELALAELKARGGKATSFAVASRGDADEENGDTNSDGGRVKKFFANLFTNKKNNPEDEGSSITTVYPVPTVVASAKSAELTPVGKAAGLASASTTTPQRTAHLQWVTGPTTVSTPVANANLAAPMPRARTINTDIASLPANSRQAAAIPNMGLPVAITGGNIPENRALGYAANDGAIAQGTAPVTPIPQLMPQPAPRTRMTGSASALNVTSDPARKLYADSACAPAALLNVKTMLFSAELHQPDHASAILFEPDQFALKTQFVLNRSESLTISRFASRAN